MISPMSGKELDERMLQLIFDRFSENGRKFSNVKDLQTACESELDAEMTRRTEVLNALVAAGKCPPEIEKVAKNALKDLEEWKKSLPAIFEKHQDLLTDWLEIARSTRGLVR